MGTKTGKIDIVNAMMVAARFPQRVRSKGRSGRWLPADDKDCNGDATLKLVELVEDPLTNGNAGVVISGKMSSGKTSTLGRMARMMVEGRAAKFKEEHNKGHEPNVPIYYLPAHEASAIMNSVWEPKMKRAFTDLLFVEILFIDDVDKLITSFLNATGRGMLDSLIRDRFNNDNPTIIASGTPTDEIDGPDSIIEFLKRSFHQIEIRSSFPEENDE